MYYQNYEDYMRQVLGYPINDPNIYETYDYRNDQMYQDTYSTRNQTISTTMSEEEMRKCYPDIYHLVYPMVCKVCETNTQPITRELIEKMTDEVYMAMEDTTTTVNIRVETPTTGENRSSNDKRNSISEDVRNTKSRIEKNSKSVVSNSENREIKANSNAKVENRESAPPLTETRRSNSVLRDLIKILILNRIFGNRPQPPRPPRPPFPGGPGRPPFPGGRPPMGPGGRPPIIQPREYPDFF